MLPKLPASTSSRIGPSHIPTTTNWKWKASCKVILSNIEESKSRIAISKTLLGLRTNAYTISMLILTVREVLNIERIERS